MNYSKFVMGLFGVYLVYYALQVLYDAFLKKEKGKDKEEEDILDVGNSVDEELTQDVEEIFTQKPSDLSTEKKKEIQIDESSFVKIQVETQGIPFEALMKDSKTLFSGVSF